jgi:hypothetical protein
MGEIESLFLLMNLGKVSVGLKWHYYGCAQMTLKNGIEYILKEVISELK